MTVKVFTHNISNVTDVTAIRIRESYNAATSQAQIECYDTTLELGDSIGFSMGFSGDSGKIFQGYVSDIVQEIPDPKVTITCEDELYKASEYFLASDDPENPFSRNNILTEDLVEDILNEASITNYTSNVPLSVTWGTRGTVEFNLVTAWQAAKNIADALAWNIYADRNGQVHLVERHPYVEGGDSADFTWTVAANDLLSLSYAKSVANLRNRVVVYGLDNLSRTASTSSPYLPAGFYKSAVLATPIIDTGSLAQRVADYNLELLNRLTETLQVQVEGDYSITPRLFADITESFTGTTGLWFIYAVEHVMDQSGYICNVTLTR
jgi:hypothetical protein